MRAPTILVLWTVPVGPCGRKRLGDLTRSSGMGEEACSEVWTRRLHNASRANGARTNGKTTFIFFVLGTPGAAPPAAGSTIEPGGCMRAVRRMWPQHVSAGGIALVAVQDL